MVGSNLSNRYTDSMFAKADRLNRSQFNHFFKQGRRIHTPCLTLIYSRSDHFHGAVVVGKKVHQKAVARNRLRRQIYSALYRWHQTHSLTGVYILIAKPTMTRLTQGEIAPTVRAVLDRMAETPHSR